MLITKVNSPRIGIINKPCYCTLITWQGLQQLLQLQAAQAVSCIHKKKPKCVTQLHFNNIRKQTLQKKNKGQISSSKWWILLKISFHSQLWRSRYNIWVIHRYEVAKRSGNKSMLYQRKKEIILSFFKYFDILSGVSSMVKTQNQLLNHRQSIISPNCIVIFNSQYKK